MKFTIPLIVLLPLLASCDTGPDLAKLCEQHPDICSEFTEDNWCKVERKNTAFARLNLKKTGKDKQKVDLLHAYEDYAKCMDHASKIEHIKLKHKKTRRIENHLKAKEKIKQLSIETKNSEHPELLYYHWSRYINKRALNKLLAMEGSVLLNTPESQFNLATYYIKRDTDKTLTLLFHALELNKPEHAINTEIFKSLTSIYTDMKEYKQAYIWLKILNLYDPDDETINEKTLIEYSKGYSLDGDFLEQVAETTLEKIQEGTFKSPRH